MAKNTKDSEPIVSGGGLFLGIMTALVEEIQSAGGTSEDIHNLGRPQGRETLHKMAELVPRPFHNKQQRSLPLELPNILVPADDVWFDLEVDYESNPISDLSMRKGFAAEWKYLGPVVSGRKVLRVKLINSDHFLYLKDARNKAAALGYRLLEGLACESFEAKYPHYDDVSLRSIIFGGNEWLHQGSRKLLVLRCPDNPIIKRFRIWEKEFYCLRNDAVIIRNPRWAVAALDA